MNTPAALVLALRPWALSTRRVHLLPHDSAPHRHSPVPTAQALGLPYAEQGQAWPMCPTCAQPLTFWAQWHAWGRLWTSYGCTHEGTAFAIEGGSPQPLAWEMRSFDAPQADKAVRLQPPGRTSAEPWYWSEMEVLSVPGPDEAVVQAMPAVQAWHQTVDEEAKAEAWRQAVLALGVSPTVGHTRVTGWPVWYQTPERTHCMECGRPHVLLAQLDPEPEVRGAWGPDALYWMGCPDHPDTVRLFCQPVHRLPWEPLSRHAMAEPLESAPSPLALSNPVPMPEEMRA